MLVGLQKTSLVNYPGRVCAAVFLPGCNLRCPYCHNGELAAASVASGPRAEHADGYVTLEDVYAHLEKRRDVIGAVTISGGEPLLSPALDGLIHKARSLNLAVKIDTNGTLPDRLASLLEDPERRPDMIALDVKTSPARYAELAIEREAGERAGGEMLRSLALLREAENEGTTRVEYRTVLAPDLVGEREIREIGELLGEKADWEFAQFSPGHCLDPEWNNRAPYGPAEAARLVEIAKEYVPGARLR